MEDHADTHFWTRWREYSGTALYYKAFLERSPASISRVLTSIARASSSGILLHYAGGRDRTGLISILLLAIAQVDHDAIASDYELSQERLETPERAQERIKIDELLKHEKTTNRDAIKSLLLSFDVEPYLRDIGLDTNELNGLRERLVAKVN